MARMFSRQKREPGKDSSLVPGRASSLSRERAPGAETHPPPFEVGAGQLRDAVGPGTPLPAPLQAELNRRLDFDFSRVRIHAGPAADHVAKSLGAEALSFGTSIAFRSDRYAPHSSAGHSLLLHEARHIAAGGAGGAVGVQLQVGVDDISEEMVGLTFKVRTAQGAPPDEIPAGAEVVVTAWNGTSPDATVRYQAKGKVISRSVPKLALTPVSPSARGVRRYTVGLPAQQTAVEKAQQKVVDQRQEVTDWRAKESSYKSNHERWEKGLATLETELARREGVLTSKQATLSRMLVKEAMYNRFDTVIARWVAHYNKELKPKKDLAPDIVKSMLFQESRMGTSGQHLELPPYSWSSGQKHPVRSRFNVGQAVDSYGHQQLLMMEEMDPALYKRFKLDELAKEMRSQDKSEKEIYAWRGGSFAKALKEFFTSRSAAGENLMGTKGRDLHEDYGFWIRTAIRWLFYKYLSLPAGSTWEDAVRAYNGGGAAARQYRKEVMARVGGKGALEVGNQ